MRQRGLVTREDCPEDRRGAVVALTDAGLHALRTAAPGHVESVRRHFLDLLTRDQVELLGEITDTVVRHLAQES